jgi:Fe-Mn family superoxide dismutase
MPFSLPALPYAYDALEPSLDARTMEIHHSKHHQAYVNNLNAAIEKAPELAGKTLDELMRGIATVPEAVRTAVRNNGGGHWNHSMFWLTMSQGGSGSGAPTTVLGEAIAKNFGAFATFQEQFAAAAAARFGSGWVWLLDEGRGVLSIVTTPNQDNPLMEGKKAILGLDVWEHAYYLKYQNRRPDYVAAWWNLVDWPVVSQRYRSP